MQDISQTKTSLCSGKYLNGSSKKSLSVYCDASFTALRNKRSTVEFSTIAKPCGLLLWTCLLKIYKKTILILFKRLKWTVTVRITTLHLVNYVWFPKVTLLDQLWPSIAKFHTQKTWPLTKSCNLLTWCSRIWSLKCTSITLVSPFLTMTTLWKSMKSLCKNGNRMSSPNCTLSPWILKNAMIMLMQKK
jgi:hypothetical protein